MQRKIIILFILLTGMLTACKGTNNDSIDSQAQSFAGISQDSEEIIACNYLGDYIGYWTLCKDVTKNYPLNAGMDITACLKSESCLTIYNDYSINLQINGKSETGLLNICDNTITITFPDNQLFEETEKQLYVDKINNTLCLKIEKDGISLFFERGAAKTSEASGLDEIAASMNIIKQYGFESNRSLLSFSVYEDSLVKKDDYFEITADFLNNVIITPEIKLYESIDICLNEIENTSVTLTCTDEGTLTRIGTGETYHFNPNSKKDQYIYSEDGSLVQSVIYRGKLKIKSDAQIGTPESQHYESFSASALNTFGSYFNSVYFDETGAVTMLLLY